MDKIKDKILLNKWVYMAMLIAILVVVAVVYTNSSKIGNKDVYKTASNVTSTVINNMNDIEKGAKSRVLSALSADEDVAYYGDTAYCIIRLNTEKTVEISDILENEARNTIDVRYKVMDKASENTGLFIFKLDGVGTKHVKVSEATDNSMEGIRNLVAVKSGETYQFVDCATNRNIDVEIVSWYGNGTYSVVLNSKEDSNKYEVAQAEDVASVELEATVISAVENYDGMIELEIGNGTRLLARNRDKSDRLLEGMKYRTNLSYNESAQRFEFKTLEMLYKIERTTDREVE